MIRCTSINSQSQPRLLAPEACRAEFPNMVSPHGAQSSIIFGNRLPSLRGHPGRRPAFILGYHNIGIPAKRARNRSNYISSSLLRQQLRQLTKSAQPQCALDEYLSREPRGDAGWSLTFDDGYSSLVEDGLTIFHETGAKALVYLVAGQIGGSNIWDQNAGDLRLPLMSAGQVRTWLAEGHEIGSHSVTHPSLSRLSLENARREMAESKARLEQQFGVAIRHFCYPYGDWNPALRDLAQEVGYATAVTVEQRAVSAEDSPWSLPRWMVYTHRFPWLANLRTRWAQRGNRA